MATETTDNQNVIDQPEVIRPKMVTIEIAGKKYEVPEGITVIKALWYSGQEVVAGRRLSWRVLRGLRDLLSDQGRSESQDLSGLPNGGAGRHVVHDDAAVSGPQGHLRHSDAQRSETGPLQSLSRSAALPELQRLHRSLPAEDRRAGRGLEGRLRRFQERVRDVHGLRDVRDVHAGLHRGHRPNLVALYVSRAQGAHFTEKPVGLDTRIKEIEDGRFNDEWAKILKMNEKELADHCATVK